MSPTSRFLFSLAALSLVAACGSTPRAAKVGPYGNPYVKGFPLEATTRAPEHIREPSSSEQDARIAEQQRAMDEQERERREQEQELREQQQEQQLDRVMNSGDHCLSCP